MEISPSSLAMFRVGQVHQRKDFVNSMDYSDDGRFLVTSGNDGSIVCYNTENGSEDRVLLSKKHGVDLIQFTHHNAAVICAPHKTSKDKNIRYLSLHDNRYLRTFEGNKDSITSLAMSPTDDSFLSGGADGTVRLWDLRTPDCSGLLRTFTSPSGKSNVVSSFGAKGVIFGAAIGQNSIKLFDARNYDAGPFSTFQVTHRTELSWRNLQFSNDGNLILLTTPQGIIVVDSFDGRLISHISGYNNVKGEPCKATFSPDGKFILIGSEDGFVHVFASTGQLISKWDASPRHPFPVHNVKFNPKTMMVASSCKVVAFWIPS